MCIDKKEAINNAADVQRVGFNAPPQRDAGETYKAALLRYMRSARFGASDDSVSWVVGKKTRVEHSSDPRKQDRSFKL
jgi:hypothetical protein